MRHLGSIVLALLLAPAIYLSGGIGLAKFAEAIADPPTVDYTPAGVAIIAMILAGALFAVLTLTRLSPLGPVLAGLAFVALGGWALLRRESFLETMPDAVLDVRGGATAGALLALPLAVPLLSTVFSPRRWRRDGFVGQPALYTAPAAYPATPAYPPAGYPATADYATPPEYGGGTPGYTAGGYPGQDYGSPSYPSAAGSPSYPSAAGSPSYLSGGGPSYPAGGSPSYPSYGEAVDPYPAAPASPAASPGYSPAGGQPPSSGPPARSGPPADSGAGETTVLGEADTQRSSGDPPPYPPPYPSAPTPPPADPEATTRL